MKINAMLAAALIAVSGAASATTTDWGQHDLAEFGTGYAPGAGTLIDDIFKFTLSAPAGVMSVSVTNDGAGGAFDLTHGMLSLYSGTPSTGTLLNSFAFDSAAVSHDWGPLPIGNYYYEVTAEVAATAIGGSYLVSSTLAAPVPEPESYAMLLAGLTAIGFVAARRKKH